MSTSISTKALIENKLGQYSKERGCQVKVLQIMCIHLFFVHNLITQRKKQRIIVEKLVQALKEYFVS